MAEYYAYQGLCLCPRGGRLPQEATPVAAPFHPLLYLVERDPLTHGALRPLPGPDALDAPEDWRCLLPADGGAEEGCYELNTAFPRAMALAPSLLAPKQKDLRLTLVGLGDVGGQLLTALKLLGDEIDEIGIYDPNDALVDRYILELNQILDRETPRIVRRSPIGPGDAADRSALTGGPVRLRPLPFHRFPGRASRWRCRGRADAAVRKESGHAARLRETGQKLRLPGPVLPDLGPGGSACPGGVPAIQPQRRGRVGFGGLLPEQIVGFGLGVMKARADFMARRLGKSCPNLRAYGPHGAGLVIANDPDAYDEALSLELTRQTVAANMEVRALGFKPYIAPAVSSACLSILQLIRGQAFHGAVPLGGVYFGCRSRRIGGFAPLAEALPPALVARIEAAWQALREEEPKCLA